MQVSRPPQTCTDLVGPEKEAMIIELSKIVNGGRPPTGSQRSPITHRSAQGLGTSEFLQDLIDASPANVAVLDSDRTIAKINRAWRRFAAQTGMLECEYGIGRTYPELGVAAASMSADDEVAVRDGILRVIKGTEVEFRTQYCSTADPENVWFRLHAASFRMPKGDGSLRILVSHEIISAEEIASVAINSEKRLHRLLSMTNIIPWEADPELSRFTFVGEPVMQILGYPPNEWFEFGFWNDHLHPDDRERAHRACKELSERFDEFQLEYRMVARDGRVVWIQSMVSVIRHNGRPKLLRGFMIDLTDRKATEDQLRHLSGRLITAQEEERKRLARELHDDLNQRIALMSIELEQLGQIASNVGGGFNTRLEKLQRRAQEISTDIHRMSYELHPSKLDHLGLVPALRSFCRELSISRGLHVNFTYDGFPADLSPEKTLCIFRVAQEALQNAAKHSGALRVNIHLAKTAVSIELEVSDSGCGFEINSKEATGGLGFTSIRERVRAVEGRIQISSSPGKGTRISVSIPLKDNPRPHSNR